jgi:hypothetical protein
VRRASTQGAARPVPHDQRRRSPRQQLQREALKDRQEVGRQVSEAPDPILEHLIVGWRKVLACGVYGDTIYVFRSVTPLGYSAVMNPAQAIGPIILEVRRSAAS